MEDTAAVDLGVDIVSFRVLIISAAILQNDNSAIYVPFLYKTS